MKTNELIQRYIYAVTKNLSPALRKDVSKELETIISDMLEERCGETEQDVLAVLAELGRPEELSEKYNPSKDKCLIGPPYYAQYKLVLKIVLACVAFGTTLASALAGAMDAKPLPQMLLTILTSVFSGALFGFTFVTILFAIFYHKGIELKTPGNFDLPPVPKKEIPRSQPILGIMFTILFVTVFLIIPQVFSAIFTQTGQVIPVFSLQYLRETWYIILGYAALGIIRESVKLIDGRYSLRLMVTSIITNGLSFLLAVLWLNKNIINPAFASQMTGMFQGDNAFIANIFANFHYIFLAVILFALVLETAQNIYYYFKTGRES